jgi:hypothetical protein
MKKYQGEDIYFSLKFTTSTDSDITSFNDLDNVIVYAYTNEDEIVKYSREPIAGYNSLVEVGIDGMKLQAVIPSDSTKTMLGQIMLDIMCVKTSTDGDLKENIIQKALSGIFIFNSLIKAEA